MENELSKVDEVLKQLVLLGDPRLYHICEKVTEEDQPYFPEWKGTMHDVMEAVRNKYGFGRAIAAPQLGIMKRVVYLNIDEPTLLLNPEIVHKGQEMIELWDDCMSFPNLLVKVRRHNIIQLRFRDEMFNNQIWDLEGDLSELLQHECDHLDGILCTMRAIDEKAFKWRDLKL